MWGKRFKGRVQNDSFNKGLTGIERDLKKRGEGSPTEDGNMGERMEKYLGPSN